MKSLLTITLLLISFLHAEYAAGFGVNVTILPKPPFSYFTTKKTFGKSLKLVKLFEKRNKITDDLEWFKKHKFYLPKIRARKFFEIYRNTRLPRRYKGTSLLEVFSDKQKYLYLIYGKNYGEKRYLFIMDLLSKKFLYGFDFINYAYSTENRRFVYQSIEYAKIDKGTLYFATYHNTYAKDSKGKNGYISALNLKTKKLIWQSQPLVMGSTNFIIYKNWIISGYGFTMEKDYLYILDKNSGRALKKYPLKSAPEYIVLNRSKLYVRTYNRDYIFKIK